MGFKVNKGLEKPSWIVIFSLAGLAGLLAGTASFGWEPSSWIRTILMIMIAVPMLIETHINEIFKSPTWTTVATAVMAIAILAQAVLNSPLLGINYAALAQFAGFSMIIGSLLIFVELVIMIRRRNI